MFRNISTVSTPGRITASFIAWPTGTGLNSFPVAMPMRKTPSRSSLRGVMVRVCAWPARDSLMTTGFPSDCRTTELMSRSGDRVLPLASISLSPAFSPAASAGDLATTSMTSLLGMAFPKPMKIPRASSTAAR
jgi:hypothetical protein